MTKTGFFASLAIGIVLGLILLFFVTSGNETPNTSWESCQQMDNGRISCTRDMP